MQENAVIVHQLTRDEFVSVMREAFEKSLENFKPNQIEYRRQFLSVRDMAQALGMSEFKIRQLCRDQEIQAVKNGKSWLIPPSEVDAFREKLF